MLNRHMQLGENWFYRPQFDIELKQYEALAFEQYLWGRLHEKALFPAFTELNIQLTSVTQFLNTVQSNLITVKPSIAGINWAKKEIIWSQNTVNETVLDDVIHIANFLLERITPFVTKYNALKDEIKQNIQCKPVGLFPAYKNEGWLLIEYATSTDVYYFKMSQVFSSTNLHTQYYQTYTHDGTYSPAVLKMELVKREKHLPNPITWVVQNMQQYPLHETVLPFVSETLQSI